MVNKDVYIVVTQSSLVLILMITFNVIYVKKYVSAKFLKQEIA